ncbi:hypothetical protein [Bradyrhizobium sp. BR 1432]|uniref:hypothetical protein n=1 Tax=Bradyrhizobium sp. BR 1432 TaxID=3447966 RepID=UPI003EE6B7F2
MICLADETRGIADADIAYHLQLAPTQFPKSLGRLLPRFTLRVELPLGQALGLLNGLEKQIELSLQERLLRLDPSGKRRLVSRFIAFRCGLSLLVTRDSLRRRACSV